MNPSDANNRFSVLCDCSGQCGSLSSDFDVYFPVIQRWIVRHLSLRVRTSIDEEQLAIDIVFKLLCYVSNQKSTDFQTPDEMKRLCWRLCQNECRSKQVDYSSSKTCGSPNQEKKKIPLFCRSENGGFLALTL